MSRLLLVLSLALGLAACEPAADSPPTVPDADVEPGATITPAQAALSRALLLDERLPLGRSETRTLPAEPGEEPRVLRRWQEGGRTVKLSATEPDDAGRMVGESTFYLHDGELFFVRGPFARYVFEDGRLIAWLDERLQTIDDVPEVHRAERETSVQQQLARYEAAFEEGA